MRSSAGSLMWRFRSSCFSRSGAGRPRPVRGLFSFGNIPVIYMTSFDGWTQDRFGTPGMLWMEALAGIVCVVLGLVAVAWLRRRPATR